MRAFLQLLSAAIALSYALASPVLLPTGESNAAIGNQYLKDPVDQDIESFVNSLSPQQRGLWTSIRDKLTSVAISTAVGAVLGKRDVNDDVPQEIETFVNALSPQHRGLWTSIRDKLTSVAISTAVGALLG